MTNNIVIIGGGASGLMAAITAAEKGAGVTIIERNNRVGKKILATGNGKCNLGNRDMALSNYYCRDYKFLERAFNIFGVKETEAFFNKIGLLIKNKNNYLYPYSEQASMVLDVLRFEAARLHIRIITDTMARSVIRGKKGFKVETDQGDFFFDKVVISCGGCASPKTGSDGNGYDLAKSFGHKLVTVVPGLVALKTKQNYMKSVSGVRAEGSIYVNGHESICEYGEIQFTDYGISGIPVFQISREINYLLKKDGAVTVTLDLLPALDISDIDEFVDGRMKYINACSAEEFFTGILNKKLMLLFMKENGIKEHTPIEKLSRKEIMAVIRMCKDWKLDICGNNSFDNAQVCAGGVSINDITDNLESKEIPGVYFAGEIIDVDGKCGGYNLQWAWTSGYIAGNAAAE